MSDAEITMWRSLAAVITDAKNNTAAGSELHAQAAVYARELSRIFRPSGCIIFLICDDGSTLFVPVGMQGDIRETDFFADMPLMKHLALTRKAIYVGQEQYFSTDLLPGEKPLSLLCNPVLKQDRVSGFIYVSSSRRNAFTQDYLAMLNLVAAELAACMEIAFLRSSLEAATVTDQLTGCYNRKKFEADIEVDIPCSERYARPLSLVKISIDFIRKYYEAYGAGQGDEVIRKVGETLLYSIRMCDRLYRFSNEEFVLILPGIDKERGYFTAQRLQKALGHLRFEGESDSQTDGLMKYSMGVASFPVDAVFKDELIRKLDAALRRAKEAGGNGVVSL